MPIPYVGEIRMFAGNFAPAGWAFCEGQSIPISENDTLFNLIGTTYGGDGQTTFNLPDLQGRLPVHWGNDFFLGQRGGAEQVTLVVQQIPVHTHPLQASKGPGNANAPAGNLTGESAAVKIYVSEQPTGNLSPSAMTSIGGSQPHENFQPYLCINFIISLSGIFPTQT